MATEHGADTNRPHRVVARRLVACSRERTLYRSDAPHGVRLVKVLETGSTADAERELHASQCAAGPGIVACHSASRDPSTGKPTLEFDFIEGIDLQRHIDERGVLRSREAAAIALASARTLHRLSTISSPAAPRGLVHRDVKPSNILLVAGSVPQNPQVMLVDLEHAVPTGTPVAGNFTGGTHGYAPPEAMSATPPDYRFDVFGFGLCLWFMLTGGRPPQQGRPARARLRSLAAAPRPLRALYHCCTDLDPDRRPTWNEVIAQLEAFLDAPTTPSAAACENAHLALATADFERASREQTEIIDPADRATIAGLRDHRLRVWSKVDADLFAHKPDSDFDSIAERAAALHSILTRFPNHDPSLTARRSLLAEFGQALVKLPETIVAARRSADFDTAHHLIDSAQVAATAVAQLGPLPLDDFAPDNVPPIVRDSSRVFELMRHDLANAIERHDQYSAQLDQAEAKLDLTAARAVVNDAGNRYGGASEITARLRERVHALEFAVSQIAGGTAVIAECERMATLAGIESDLTPLSSLVERCQQMTMERHPSTPRTLLGNLEDIGRYADRTEPVTEPGRHTLQATLSSLTDRAWELVSDSETALTAQPIPIRPLQTIINQFDALCLSDVLIDRPGRQRAALIDTIENLRIRLDRARATRDRIARGAKDAMDRGHLTTALFDMERVVDQFDEETSGTVARPLSDQYKHAKRLKQDVEHALRANHALAARYRALCDNTDVRLEDSIALLRERDRLLAFLCANAGARRRDLFEADLAIVRHELFEQLIRSAQYRFATCATVAERIDATNQTVQELTECEPASHWTREQCAAREQTIMLWRDRAAGQISNHVNRSHPSRSDRAAYLPRTTKALIGVASVAVFVLLAIWRLSPDANAAEHLYDWRNGTPSLTANAFSQLHTRLDHLATHDDLSAATIDAARGLLTIAQNAGRDSILPTWGAQLTTALQRMADGVDHSLPSAALCESFARDAHTASCIAALANPKSIDDLRTHIAATQDLLPIDNAIAAYLWSEDCQGRR